MVETAAYFLYFLGLVAAVFLSLGGKINLSLLIFVPLLPLQNVLYRFHRYPLGKDFVDLVIVSMLLGWLIKSISAGERMIERTPFNLLSIALIVFTFVSFVQGSFYLGQTTLASMSERAQTWKNYMLLPVLYLITVNNVRTAGEIKLLLLFMFGSMLLVDFYTMRQISYTSGLASRDKLVGTFVFLNSNHLAAFYAMCVCFLAGLWFVWRDKLPRFIMLGLIVAGIFVTLFLYSRGAYVAVLAGFLMIALLKKRALIIPILIVLVSWEVVLPKDVIDRIKETRTEDGALDSSSQHRLELWKESIGLFMSSPLTGIGFDVIYVRGLLGRFKDTHNVYMKVLAEQGLIGIVLLLLILWRALKVGLRLHRITEDGFLKGLGLGFTACVVALATANVFGDRWMFLQIGGYFWVLLALSMRALLIAESGEEAAA